MRTSLTDLPQDAAGACHITSDGCGDDASIGRSDSTAGCRTCSSALNEGLRCGTEPGPGDAAMLAGLDRGDATALNDGVEGCAGDMPLLLGRRTATDFSVAAELLASSCRRHISFTLIVFSVPAKNAPSHTSAIHMLQHTRIK